MEVSVSAAATGLLPGSVDPQGGSAPYFDKYKTTEPDREPSVASQSGWSTTATVGIRNEEKPERTPLPSPPVRRGRPMSSATPVPETASRISVIGEMAPPGLQSAASECVDGCQAAVGESGGDVSSGGAGPAQGLSYYGGPGGGTGQESLLQPISLDSSVSMEQEAGWETWIDDDEAKKEYVTRFIPDENPFSLRILLLNYRYSSI